MMSLLFWIGIAIAIVVVLVVIGVVFASRRISTDFDAIVRGEKERPTSKDSYLYYQRWRIEKTQENKIPIRELYQYVASETNHIFVSGDTETKMNWLNGLGLILNHDVKPQYTSEVWEEEGFKSLHLRISEYAKQISSKELDFPSRPNFDEVYAKYKDRI